MKTSRAALIAAALLFAAAAPCRAADDEIDAATKARIAEFDKGTPTVDVSGYPKEIQNDYRIFSQKCSVCHTLARPINSDFALPDEWSRYVKRMMFKPGSMITAKDAKKIYTFLVYDSSVRKKDMLDSKMGKLTPEEKTAQEAKIKEILGEVDGK